MAFDFVHPSKLGIVHVHSEAEEGRRQSDPIKIDSYFQKEKRLSATQRDSAQLSVTQRNSPQLSTLSVTQHYASNVFSTLIKV